MWDSYNIATFVVNVFIAIGTCGAVVVSLYLALRKKEEKLDGEYYFATKPSKENCIIVHLTNNSSESCVLEKESYLWIDVIGDSDSAGLVTHRTDPLGATEVIPPQLTCEIKYKISNEIKKEEIKKIYLYTRQGTLKKLRKKDEVKGSYRLSKDNQQYTFHVKLTNTSPEDYTIAKDSHLSIIFANETTTNRISTKPLELETDGTIGQKRELELTFYTDPHYTAMIDKNQEHMKVISSTYKRGQAINLTLEKEQ